MDDGRNAFNIHDPLHPAIVSMRKLVQGNLTYAVEASTDHLAWLWTFTSNMALCKGQQRTLHLTMVELTLTTVAAPRSSTSTSIWTTLSGKVSRGVVVGEVVLGSIASGSGAIVEVRRSSRIPSWCTASAPVLDI